MASDGMQSAPRPRKSTARKPANAIGNIRKSVRTVPKRKPANAIGNIRRKA